MQRALKFTLLITCFAFLPWKSHLNAQIQLQDRLDELNQKRLRLSKQGMLVLGGWAVANMGWSGYRMSQTEGSTRSFHQMNVAWNAVNLGIAGLAYWGSHRARNKQYDLAASVKEQKKIEGSLLINTGLDVGYMAFGLYLRERSKNEIGEDADRFLGWGNSLILQGGFLFAYDIVMSVVQQRHGNRGVFKLLERVQPMPGGVNISIPLR